MSVYFFTVHTFEANLEVDFLNKEKIDKFVCCCWLVNPFLRIGTWQKTKKTQNLGNFSRSKLEIKIDLRVPTKQEA